MCSRWRRIILDSPNRLGLTLVCTQRTPVEDLLAHSPTFPIIIHYSIPFPSEPQNYLEGIRLALLHRDRVCRIHLWLPSSSLRKVFNHMKGPFPVLETLQLSCSSLTNECARLPSTFKAPKLRHLQLSDFTLVPQKTPPLNTTICPPSLVSFSLGEITPIKYQSPAVFVECLSVMPQLKSLKIGYLVPVEQGGQDRSSRQASHSTLLLTNLEELQFRGKSDYFEALAARITAPSLKKLSLTFTDWLEDVTLPNLSELIRGTTDLSKNCKFARVKFEHETSIVIDQNELRTGRGAFELMLACVRGKVLSKRDERLQYTSVQSFHRSLTLRHFCSSTHWLAGGHGPHGRRISTAKCGIDGLFKDVDTLRVVDCLVDELDNALQPDAGDRDSIRTALPKLKKVVLYGPYGSRVVQSVAI